MFHIQFPITMNSSQLLSNVSFQLDRWVNVPVLSDTTYTSIAVVCITTLIIGSIGNTAVVVLFVKYKSLRTTHNILVMSLITADILMCILCLPVLVFNCVRKHSLYADILFYTCNYDAFVGAFSGFLSILSLTAIAIDRCVTISRGRLTTHSIGGRNTPYAAIIIMWILAACGAAMPFLGYGRYVFDNSQIFCTFDFYTKTYENLIYNAVIETVFFVIPVATITSCYIKIYVTVRSHEKKFFKVQKTGEMDTTALRRIRRSRNHERNELKTAKAAFVLVLVFCMSWMPYNVVSLVCLHGNSSGIARVFITLPGLFAKLSTIFNPLLYALMHRSFRSKLRACSSKNAATSLDIY